MKKFLYFLFPVKPVDTGFSIFLLCFRILFGILLMTHGLQKWSNFGQLSNSFADPIGLGSTISLGLAIFGEVACSIGFIFGAFYRLAIIPMIIIMLIAIFAIHGGDPFADKELAFAYMMVYIIMFFAGPGKYALDAFIAKAIRKP